MIRTILISLLIGVCAAVTTASAYIAWSSYQDAEAMKLEISVYRTAGLTKYGIVKSVDAGRRTLTVLFPRVYTGSEVGDKVATSTFIQNVTVVVQIPDGAYIARQDLSGTDDEFSRLSPQDPQPLSAIKPGDHVVIASMPNTKGVLVSPYVLFGNPL